jgi:hypothetical protein
MMLMVLAVLAGCVARPRDGSRTSAVPQVRAVAGSTRKVCQLTGDSDSGVPTPLPVRSQTVRRAHLLGTDLGISFSGPTPGTVHFLFGDSVPSNPGEHEKDDDAVAFARADADPEGCPDLTFYTDAADEYAPLKLAGFELGSFEVPTGGFATEGATFAIFATQAVDKPRHPTRSVLALSEHFPQERTFSYVEDLPPAKLLNVAVVLVDDTWRPGPRPTRALFFGTGAYRSSTNVSLAAFPLETLRSGAHEWFAGRDSSAGARWSASEGQARPLFDRDGAGCMGELSVTWNPHLGSWLMLYDCTQPRGIVFRVAAEPWGPWSEPRVLFEPRADHGYCEFIHDADPQRHCPAGSPNPKDHLIARSEGVEAYGGEYGAYVIDAFTKGNVRDRSTTIYFTMSTWNPYEVVLMEGGLQRTDEDGEVR